MREGKDDSEQKISAYRQGIKLFKEFGLLSTLGIYFVIATFIGLGIGYYIDSKIGTRPYFTIIFLVLGIATGFLNLFKVLRDQMRKK